MNREIIGLRVEPELARLIEAEASKQHRSVSNFIRFVVASYLNFHEKDGPQTESEMVRMGRRGGLERAKRLSPEERSEVASKAGKARWVGAATSDPLTISIKRAIELSGLGLTTIYKLIKDGTLETVSVTSRRLILYASLKVLLQPEPKTARKKLRNPPLPGAK